jgi:hypothetical protein
MLTYASLKLSGCFLLPCALSLELSADIALADGRMPVFHDPDGGGGRKRMEVMGTDWLQTICLENKPL